MRWLGVVIAVIVLGSTIAALAQTHKRFMLPGLGNAILLETTGSSIDQAVFAVLERESCTRNPADNNCWLILETNTPGWTGHP